MCVIAVIPKGKPVDQADLKKCWNRNPDSAGYVFSSEGSLLIKRFLEWEPFIKHFVKDFEKSSLVSNFLVHFRIATSGGVNLDNCHPFSVNRDHAVVHNGVLGPGKGKKSDTHLFRDEILTPLFSRNPKVLEDQVTMELLRRALGSSNKMVFMRRDGKYKIVNEAGGTWKAGLWYSNTHWDYTPPTMGYYKKGYWEKDHKAVSRFKKCFWCTTLTSNPDGFCNRCYNENNAYSDPFFASDKYPGIERP